MKTNKDQLDFEFERDLCQYSASLFLGAAVYLTTLGTINPWLIFIGAVLGRAFVVGIIIGVRAGIKESKK